MNPPPPSSTLFPYTTLFRSQCLPCPGQERITIIDRTRPARFDIEIKLEKVLGAFDAVDIGRLRDAIDSLNAKGFDARWQHGEGKACAGLSAVRVDGGHGDDCRSNLVRSRD